MKKNLYEILGVDSNATQDDIKKAYKKLAIKYHPDKWAGHPENERKQAEETFKDITGAYEILKDPDKRMQYDRFGTTDQSSAFNGFDASDIFGSFFDSFAGFDPFGHNGFNAEWNAAASRSQAGTNIDVAINVTLSQLMNQDTVDVMISRKVRCKHCKGEGGSGSHTCPTCRGTGMHKVTTQRGGMIFSQTTTCQTCHGTGKVVDKKCEHCDGSGFETINVKQPIRIPQDPRTPVVMNNMGNESKDPSLPTGSLIVHFNVVYDKSRYNIVKDTYGQSYSIYEKLNVSYYDAILGFEKIMTLPNGAKLNVTFPKYMGNENNIKLKGKGLCGGDYIYVINVQMPKHVSDEEIKLLNKIKNINS